MNASTNDRATRAAVLVRPGLIEVVEQQMPEPESHEVLVKVAAVGVCGSDVHYFESGKIGAFVVTAPLILGHEASGTVMSIGPEVTKHAVGDRVTIEPGIPCGRCAECRRGTYNLCQAVRFLATPPIDGAFRTHLTVHEDFAFSLPSSLSDEAGALIEPLSVAIWASRTAGVNPGDRVLITGAGPIGLLVTQVVRASGATQIEVSDTNRHRLAMARTAGATRTLAAGVDEPSESDVLIECSGNEDALTAGIFALRPGGTAVVVGMSPTGHVSIPLDVVQTRELRLTGTFRYAHTYPSAIALASTGAVNVEMLITGRYGLDETEQALRAGLEDPTSIKAIVRP